MKADESPGDSDVSDAPKKERRIRYSGSYPKAFKDRYKEMRGDAATISKVLAKGSTPAGEHFIFGQLLYNAYTVFQ